ncbi:hypothetical protein [Halomonas sp. YLGW01]|uniref:hypothetical protein n=1 Tax=Halomonas sp. YLGW01 TaxID=2773308 RepID=UPI0017813B02|nr:hypothetical protein [Halomonas sp. YLGW01]
MNEPQRLQYLEAMGLTAWVGRYRLPNAAPTEACDWEAPAAPAPQPHAARLQALIDDASAPRSTPSQQGKDASVASRDGARGEEAPAARGAGRARALLAGDTPVASPDASPASSAHDEAPAGPKRHAAPDAPVEEAAESTPGEALRFSLQIAALEGRWLLVLPAEAPPEAMPRRLLANLLRAAGIRPAEMPAFQHFRWPMMDELPVAAPLEEARDGLRAFLEGRRRQGWRPERLLVFGEDDTLSRVLGLEADYCPLLELPAWQGPSLEALAAGAEAKRALWPTLRAWGEAWQETQAEVAAGQTARRDEDAVP